MRNPGSEGDIKTRNYILDTFAGYNLDVREPEPYDIKMYHPISWSLINFMSNPPYMYYPEDTKEVVATDQLVPTANVIASILRTADNLPKEDLR